MKPTNIGKHYVRIASIVLIAVMIAYYVYLLRVGMAQEIMKSIRNYGLIGIVLGILFQALVNMLPVPGEFTSIILMEIYGPFWGGVFSMSGGIIGAVGGMYLARWMVRPSVIGNPYISKLDMWIDKKGNLGRLLIRFVPLVPYHLVNYAAGILKVRLSTFIWTTALGILPYTIAVSGLYAGIRRGSIIWGIAGIAIFLMLTGVGLRLKRSR